MSTLYTTNEIIEKKVLLLLYLVDNQNVRQSLVKLLFSWLLFKLDDKKIFIADFL